MTWSPTDWLTHKDWGPKIEDRRPRNEEALGLGTEDGWWSLDVSLDLTLLRGPVLWCHSDLSNWDFLRPRIISLSFHKFSHVLTPLFLENVCSLSTVKSLIWGKTFMTFYCWAADKTCEDDSNAAFKWNSIPNPNMNWSFLVLYKLFRIFYIVYVSSIALVWGGYIVNHQSHVRKVSKLGFVCLEPKLLCPLEKN